MESRQLKSDLKIFIISIMPTWKMGSLFLIVNIGLEYKTTLGKYADVNYNIFYKRIKLNRTDN